MKYSGLDGGSPLISFLWLVSISQLD